MRNEGRWFRRVGVLMASVAMMFGVARGVSAEGRRQQQQQQPVRPANGAPEPGESNANDPEHAKQRERQVEAASDERRKRLVTDSNRLLELATELKQEVDKSTKNEMSLTAIRKAAEMEKLAHDVKERMKGN